VSADNLIPLPPPREPTPQVLDGELLSDDDHAGVIAHRPGSAEFGARMAGLVRGVVRSPQLIQLRAVAGYRLRQAPRDLARLGWFFLRGNGRWIAKCWTWATHGDLRADARADRLAGDQQARRMAQETIQADAHARWAKIGRMLHYAMAGGLLIAFLAGVLALVDSQVPRAEMWPWLASVYTVLGVLAVVGLWVLKAVPLGWLIAAIWEGRDKTGDLRGGPSRGPGEFSPPPSPPCLPHLTSPNPRQGPSSALG
jgi:DNA segregation ATPase FtsK/SpoIIIE, S-DNA-T family